MTHTVCHPNYAAQSMLALRFFSMLEKYEIKFCLSVSQTFSHDNFCLFAILIMFSVSIMEMRIQLCVCATKGHWGPFLKVSE